MSILNIFVPEDRRQALVERRPLQNRAEGAALFADISGFTPMAEALTDELGSQRGAEELTRSLNGILGLLVSESNRFGGSVVGFSGDSLTSWFDGDSGYRATRCALEMQQAIKDLGGLTSPSGRQIPIAMKAAVAVGLARRFLVGDPKIQVIDVLAGSLMDDLATAEQMATRGEVVLAPSAISRLGDRARISDWRIDHESERRFGLLSGLDFEAHHISATSSGHELLSEDQLRPWLLAPVYERLKEGQGEFFSELRTVVALFIRFRGIDYDGDDSAGKKLDAFVTRIQHVLMRYEAALLELTVGDKGSYFYAAFGAPVAHEDEPTRAASAALELRKVADEFDYVQHVQMGISQGEMRVGAYGGSTRSAYGVQGNDVNIAARLMTHAEPRQILVTQRIADAISGKFDLRELGNIPLKGQSKPLPSFALLATSPDRKTSGPHEGMTGPMVGRDAERAIVVERLHALLEGKASTIMIDGEAGIGKSRLVAELFQQSESLGIPILLASANAIEQSTTYYAWRTVFQDLFGLGDLEDAAAVRQRVQSRLSDDQAAIDRVPLLNVVLPLGLADTDLTSQMTRDVRADNTRELLASLLKAFTDARPFVLVIEDAHWLDSASWDLLGQVQTTIPRLLIVIVTRPPLEEDLGTEGLQGRRIPSELRRLLAAPDAQQIHLTTLPPSAIPGLIRHRLMVTHLPDALVDLVIERAEGHPFFSEEIIYSLRDSGLIRVEDDRIVLSSEAKDLKDIDLPDTVQGVITNRLDHLPATDEMALKVASVIGRIFLFRTLRDIHPVEVDKPNLAAHMANLERLDITPIETPEPNLAHIFKHSITQEVVYNLMTFNQRIQLHREMAEWIESNHGSDLASHYPSLAYHWGRSESRSKTLHYLERAGAAALRSFANREAVAFLTEALELDAQAGRPTDAARRAHWHLQIGEALVHWTRYGEARDHLEQGLELLGLPSLAGKPAILRFTGLLKALARQLSHRLRPRSFLGSAPREQQDLLAASRAFSRLVEVYYHSGKLLLGTHAAFHALNLAELAGDSPELAEAYAPVGSIVSFARLKRAADSYFERAIQVADRSKSEIALSYVLLVRCTYETGSAQWEEAEATSQQLVKLAARLGATRRYNDGLALLTALRHLRGEFGGILEPAQELLESATAIDDRRFVGYALFAQAYGHLRRSGPDEALERLDELRELFASEDRVTDEQLEMKMHGLYATAWLLAGDAEKAVEAADRGLELAAGAFQTSYSALPGYSGPAEVYLRLAETESGSDEYRSRAGIALAALGRYANTFTIGRPRAGLLRGRGAWSSGKHQRAMRIWRRALRAADAMHMPYEAASLRLEWGQHLAAGSPERNRLLAGARDGFLEAGADYDLTLVETALTGSGELG